MNREVALSEIEARAAWQAAAFPSFPAMVDLLNVFINVPIPIAACRFKIVIDKLYAGIDLIDRHKSEAIRTIHFIDSTVTVVIFRNDCG